MIPTHGAPMPADANHRLVTEESVWTIADGVYVRLPRVERPRPPLVDVIDGSLLDGRQHAHRGGRWEWDAAGLHLRIWPAHRIVGSLGVVTGPIAFLDGVPVPPAMPDGIV